SVIVHSQPSLVVGEPRSLSRSTNVALHAHEHVVLAPDATHVVAAFARSLHGFGARTQYFFAGSQLKRPSHAVVLRRSQTFFPPGTQGNVCTQFVSSSQYDPFGHAA